MTTKARTIQIFLPSGDPTGIRIAEITTRIVRVVEVPRAATSEFLKMPEAIGGAVYLLFGTNDESTKPQVYIGQTGELKKRLAQHNQKKAFWQRAVILLSRADSLTTTHSQYLERICIKRAKEVNRFKIENDTQGNKLNTSPPLEAECEELFETAVTLISTLGYPIFVPTNPSTDTSAEKFYCDAAGTNATAEYNTQGLVVLKGSKARIDVAPNFKEKPLFKTRQKLIESGILVLDDGHLRFTQNYVFSSPSSAAAIVVGNSKNGWITWKNEKGKTLDEVKRQTLT